MSDEEILNLFFQRNDSALKQASTRYGNYCKAIAARILGNDEEAEECFNDALLKTWNTIPPNRPNVLSGYIGKIVRNIAFDKYRREHAQKRGSGDAALILDELGECIESRSNVEQEYEKKELVRDINNFLGSIPQKKRALFLCRYWYAFQIPEIAEKFGMSEGNVSVTLNRIRNKLKDYLNERGYVL